MFEPLGQYETVILQKEQYYIGRQAARSKEIDREGREGKEEILPWIFGRVNPKVCSLVAYVPLHCHPKGFNPGKSNVYVLSLYRGRKPGEDVAFARNGSRKGI